MRDIFQSHYPRRVQRVLRWTQYGLLLAGVLALACYAAVTLYAHGRQFYLNQSFEQSLKHKPILAPRPAEAPQPGRVVGNGSLFGRIEIPRLDLSVMVLEGADARTLQLGAGHIPGTAFPGESGNVGIAAHRDTFFRALQNIRKEDRIRLTTTDGSYQYVVESTEVVDPNDTEVLATSDHPTLTLVTCYPFHFVGAAPRRFIVHARKRAG